MIIQYTVLTAHHSSFIIPIHLLPYSIHDGTKRPDGGSFDWS